MDVEELLARAWGAVEKAGIPEAIQEYAFKEALTLLSAAPVAPPDDLWDAEKGDEEKDSTSDQRSDAQLFEKFSQESGVLVDHLERLYYFEDGTPHVNGPRSRFGANVADQARAVALALTSAYDFAMDRPGVPAATVRAECERLKCDPGSNWVKVMNALTTVNYVGAPGKKTLRTKNDTAEALQKLALSVLSTSG
ncbi:MAG: hypothetical protein EPO52_11220 [Herbiconiux sp.]|uniref:hypothetical protein n=1 Tax=Herbiconiux sp. TaxID=1871186 RepID=UPI00121DDDF1|nr:hypothetical protein [Herbiconiux sp.]TAJ48673.1 MAG: hypothetical protein EPO52_11220 [Herbiconiux sp.]